MGARICTPDRQSSEEGACWPGVPAVLLPDRRCIGRCWRGSGPATAARRVSATSVSSRAAAAESFESPTALQTGRLDLRGVNEARRVARSLPHSRVGVATTIAGTVESFASGGAPLVGARLVRTVECRAVAGRGVPGRHPLLHPAHTATGAPCTYVLWNRSGAGSFSGRAASRRRSP